MNHHRHRQRILLALAALILLNTGPVFGHHVGDWAGAALAGTDHLGALCLIALHALLGPVHSVFHVLIAIGLAYALFDRWRAWRTIRLVSGAVEARIPAADDPFGRAAASAGVPRRRIRIVPGLPLPALTAGWLRPMIYVAPNLARHLGPQQLAAVLAHEGAHARRHDPLRLSALRFVSCLLFWIPALREIERDWAQEAEMAADEVAAGNRPLVLALALVTLASLGTEPVRGTTAIVGGGDVDRRVRHLLGEPVRCGTHVSRRSITSAAVALVLVWSSGTIVAHPLPDVATHAGDGHTVHAPVHERSSLECLLNFLLRSDPDCPHVAS